MTEVNREIKVRQVEVTTISFDGFCVRGESTEAVIVLAEDKHAPFSEKDERKLHEYVDPYVNEISRQHRATYLTQYCAPGKAVLSNIDPRSMRKCKITVSFDDSEPAMAWNEGAEFGDIEK